jgi:hypothetical protein
MGKKGHELSKNLRQELLLQILQTFGSEGITTSEVFEIIDNKCPGFNRRTVLRDLIELSSTFPIFDEVIDGKSRWFIKKDSGQVMGSNFYREFFQKQLIDFLKKREEKEVETSI